MRMGWLIAWTRGREGATEIGEATSLAAGALTVSPTQARVIIVSVIC